MGNRYQGRPMSVLRWTWVLLPVMLSLMLLSSCNTGGGSSTVPETFVVVWNSSEDLGGEISGDTDIFFSRSTDRGATWSAVEILNSNAASDVSVNDSFPVAMTNGSDTWVAVWLSNADIDGGGTDLDIVYSRSTDDGMTWSDPHLLDSNATSGANNDEMPVLMTDGNGTWVTVWPSSEDFNGAGTDNDIFFSRSTDNGATWGASQLLNTDAATDTATDKDWHPVLMTDGEGTWIAAWSYLDNTTDTDIHFARSTNGGASWSAPQALNSNAAQATGSGSRFIGMDIRQILLPSGSNCWTAVWQSNEDLDDAGEDDDIFFARSSNGGTSWGASQALNSNAATDTGDDRFGDED